MLDPAWRVLFGLTAAWQGMPGGGGADPVPAARAEILRDRAFGAILEIEVRGLDGAPAGTALDAGLAAVRATEAALDRAALDRLATDGGGPPSGGPLREILLKAIDFCLWSDGGVSPLGRPILDLWGWRRPATGIPPPAALARVAVLAADCANLRTALATGASPSRDLRERAWIALAPRLDLWGFERGFAVDRAVDALRGAGARNGRARIGPVSRGFGTGPAGEGWPIIFEPFTSRASPVAPVLLRDRALAVAAAGAEAITIGGETVPPYFDQRTGRPGESKVAVLASTELATDAEALAMALFSMPTREGEFRAGTLRPPPSLLWLLGTGTGEPLVLEARWSALRKR